jgi:hypothetical protein
VLLLGLVLAGFSKFYLHGQSYPGRPIPPPIRTLVIAHGVAMTAWMGLFVVQSLLILGRRWPVHAILGGIGAGLAAILVVLGLKLGIEAMRITPPEVRIWGLAPRQFLAVPVVSILIFGGCVAAAIACRNRPAWHKPLMLLAMLAAVPAAVSRIGPLSALYQGTAMEWALGPFFMTTVLGAALVLVKWAWERKFDRVLGLGYVALTLAFAAIVHGAKTGAWDAVAGMLLG